MAFFEGAVINSVSRAEQIYTEATEGIYYKPRRSYGFVFYLKGPCRYVYPYRDFTAERDMFLFLPKGEIYEIHPPLDCACILINLDTVEPVSDTAFGHTFRNSQQLKDVFFRATTVFRQRRAGWQAELISLSYKIIALIQSAEMAEHLPHSVYMKLETAVSAIDSRFCDPGLKISDLARLCGMSERYFSRLFSRFYGTPPKQYIMNMRLGLAKSMLQNGNTPVGKIASICGFSSSYYFSREFREAVGLSPTEYRQISIY